MNHITQNHNRIINYNFLYIDNQSRTIGWNIEGSVQRITDTTTPVGTTALSLQYTGDSINQDYFVIDNFFGRQQIKMYAVSKGQSIIQVSIKLYGRHRNLISTKEQRFTAAASWNEYEFYIICTPATEKASIKVEYITGERVLIGGVFCSYKTHKTMEISKFNILTKNQKQMPLPTLKNYDETYTVNLITPAIIDYLKVSLDDRNKNNDIRICDGVINRFEPISYNKDGFSIFDGERLDRNIHIPHLSPTDYWTQDIEGKALTQGGSIPDNDTRYYGVTAVCGGIETTLSNQIRVITGSSGSNNNRAAVEITPVKQADRYNLYMTKKEASTQPWQYQVNNIKLLDWTQAVQVLSVTAEELRNSGYVVYDTGSSLGTKTQIPYSGAVTASVIATNPINAIKYIPHDQCYCAASNNAIYKSDMYDKYALYKIKEVGANITALDYYNDMLWYMTVDGIIHSFTDDTVYHDSSAKTAVGFTMLEGKYAKLYSDQSVSIITTSNMSVNTFMIQSSGTFTSIRRFFDKFIVYEAVMNKIYVISNSGTVEQQLDFPTLTHRCFDISGDILAVYSDFAVMLYKIMAEQYYGNLETKNALDMETQVPTIPRPILPGEGLSSNYSVLSNEETVYCDLEMLYNNDFSLFKKGASIPTGWYLEGAGASEMKSAIHSTTMQSQGKAFHITLTPYDKQRDNWQAFDSEKFSIYEGDETLLTFYYKNLEQVSAVIRCTLYFLQSDGSFGTSDTQYISLGAVGGKAVVKFAPIPSGYCKGIVRIFPQHGLTNIFEYMSLKVYTDTNLVLNNDFSYGLSAWSYSSKAVSFDTTTGYNTLKIDIDRNTATYADAVQVIELHQNVPQPITINVTAKGQSTGSGRGGVRVDIRISYVDSTPDRWEQLQFAVGVFDWTTLTGTYMPEQQKLFKTVTVYLAAGWGEVCTGYFRKVEVIQQIPSIKVTDIDLAAKDIQICDTIRILRVTAILKNGINRVEVRRIKIDFKVPKGCSLFHVEPTNAKGTAAALYKLSNVVGKFTITAAYGYLTQTAVVTVYPFIQKSKQQISIKAFPTKPISKLYLEVTHERSRKPLPLAKGIIGTWEVFRPTVFNIEQMPDYHMHYSPESHVDALKPEVTSVQYPKQMYFEYFDYLSDYPSQLRFQQMIAVRKEWLCLCSAGAASPFGDGRGYFNWRDLECSDWYITMLLERMRDYGDGLYLDDFWGESYNGTIDSDWDVKPSELLNFNSVQERIQFQKKALLHLRDELHKRGKWLTCNYGCSRKFDFTKKPITFKERDEILVEPFDGYLLESWLYSDQKEPYNISNPNFTLEYVRNQIEFIKWTGENDKWVVVLARSTMQNYDARIFCLAAFLMGKHDKAYYNFSIWGPPWEMYGEAFHGNIVPEQKIFTGEPLGNYSVTEDGLFSRPFQNCIVLINMGSTNVSYTLPTGVWYSTRKTQYRGTITVNTRSAFVLVRNLP